MDHGQECFGCQWCWANDPDMEKFLLGDFCPEYEEEEETNGE